MRGGPYSVAGKNWNSCLKVGGIEKRSKEGRVPLTTWGGGEKNDLLNRGEGGGSLKTKNVTGGG